MPRKSIFPDCAFPDDCQCAARGYEHERDSCAVPDVAASAASLGIDPGAVIDRGRRWSDPPPPPAVVMWGSVQPLPNSGDLAADVLAALTRLDMDRHYTRDELARVIEYERISAGLRAEAGYGGSNAVILYTVAQTLRHGGRLMRWLTLSQTRAGDAVYWNVALSGATDPAVACGTAEMLEAVCANICRAGGGTDAEPSEHRADVPSEDDIKAAWTEL